MVVRVIWETERTELGEILVDRKGGVKDCQVSGPEIGCGCCLSSWTRDRGGTACGWGG